MASKAEKKALRENCLNELRKNTEVIDATFERMGLQVIQQSWALAGDGDNGYLDCFVEFTGSVEDPDDDYFTIKGIIYDSNGQIAFLETHNIEISKYLGYDTIKLQFYDEGTVYKASKARVFVVRGLTFT